MKISNYLVSLRLLWGRDSFLLCTDEVQRTNKVCVAAPLQGRGTAATAHASLQTSVWNNKDVF